MIWEFVAYAGIGCLIGFFAGLLGIGGGLIGVPLLIFVLSAKFHDFHYIVQMAVATSLSIIVMTSISSFLTHAKGGRVLWRIAACMLAGAVVGVPTVAFLAQYIPAIALQSFLVLFMLYHSRHMFIKRHSDTPITPDTAFPKPPWLAAMGVFVGGTSALFGVGAGAISVPYLSRRGVSLSNAIGTSAFMGCPLALLGAASYVFNGLGRDGLPEYAWGYVYLPAFACVAVFSMMFAIVGARMTTRLPELLLRRVFGVLLLVLALQMIRQMLQA